MSVISGQVPILTGYHESKHCREAKKREKKGLLTQETIKPNHIVKSDLKKKGRKKNKKNNNDRRKKSGDEGRLHNRPKFQDGAWWKTNKHGRGTHAKQTNARLTLNKNLS